MRADSILPFPAPSTSEAPKHASAELASSLRGELAWAAAQEEEPDFELLERYVHGELDAESAEALESRAAADPELAREIDDLVALRVKLSPAAATGVVRAPARRARLSWLAAALLLAALGLDWSLERRSTETRVAGADRAAAPQAVYADGFESGDASAWAN
jgi:hypothetical protein